MKRLCLLVVAFLLTAAQVHAQGQGKYVNSSAARLVKMVDAANVNGYKLQNDGFSVGGAWLKQGTDHWVPIFSMKLQAGKEYRLIAVGDMDARDVDIQIVNDRGQTTAADTATNPEAIVNFTPATTGTYTVRLRLYSSVENRPSMCLAIIMAK